MRRGREREKKSRSWRELQLPVSIVMWMQGSSREEEAVQEDEMGRETARRRLQEGAEDVIDGGNGLR